AAASCSEPLDNPENRTYNVLLITVDTLRADHLGAYGYEKIDTPNIDRLAAEGICFKNAYTPCPVTLPAHVSIMTGAYPFAHGVRNNGVFHVPDGLITLAERLKNKGYATGAVIGSYVMDARFGLNQGFDHYDDAIKKDKGDSASPFFFPERKAEEITQRSQAFIRQNKNRPFFLWAHYFDPHAVYQPPPPFDRQYQDIPYDGEVAYVDEQIGKLLKLLRILELQRETLVVLTADHGEGLGEHNEESHGAFVYDTTLHVPLIVSNPDLIVDPQSVESLVCLTDIMPTVLDILNLEEEGECLRQMQGVSLVPLITGRSQKEHELLYFETLLPYFDFGWAGLRGVRSDKIKYIAGPDPELYFVEEDPGELDSRYEAGRKIAEQLHASLTAMAATSDAPSNGTVSPPMDEEMQKKLSALGYSSGARHSSIEGDPFQGADPKSRIWVETAINKASAQFSMGHFTEALAGLESLYEKEPENPNAIYYLAFMNGEMGRLDRAIELYLRLVELQPIDERGWNNLGVLYSRQGRNEEALQVFENALKRNPNRPDTHYNIALIHLEEGNDILAETSFLKTLELQPDHVNAYNNLGSIYATRGAYSEALEAFLKAIAIDPGHGAAHKNCAQCYLMLKEYKKAVWHLDRAIQLGQPVEPSLVEELKSYR
ncbi:MAG: sulfatase-like hydrolase/transferase, partial [Planctomycetota bacterium]